MRTSAKVQLALLLCVAVVLGGGGVAYGLMNLVVQLVALTILAVNWTRFAAFWKQAPLSIAVLVALTLALPLLQLVPLPPNLWQALPGRELAVEARELVSAQGWFPLTLDQNRTLVAATGLIAPLCVLVLAWQAPLRDLEWTGWVLVALGLLSFAIGVPQVLSNGHSAILYPENPMPGVLFGTFANRNSTGIFLVACLALLALPYESADERRHLIARLVTGALLVVAVILTRSRSAIVLMILPLALLAWQQLRPRREVESGRERQWLGAIAVSGALLAALVVATPHTRIEANLARFSATEDARAAIWEDALHSVGKYWPVGAGMGTFDEVFQADESLENLTLRRAGRAHNDYLELAVEAGLPGALVLLGWLAMVAWMAIAARSSPHRWTAWAGANVLAVFVFQSLTDYPLRNQALLCMAAFALALLARAALPDREVQP